MARKIQVEIVGDSKSVERAFGRAQKSGRSFGSVMSTIGKTAFIGVGAGLVGFGVAMRAGFKEVAEAQKVAAQTNAVLRSTGSAANVTAKHVDQLATAISRMSGIDDEAVAAAENLLLTFTNIRNEAGKGNDIFDQTTKATVDMATAMGMDLNSAAIMVGKALNQMDVTAQGNVRGFMALRRVGVQISPELMKQAVAFIKQGKAMEAQKLLLRELRTEFGGSAKAFGTTLPGAMGKLKNALDEVLGAFATGFLPLITRVGNALTKKLADPAFVARVQRLGTLIGTTLYNAFAKVGAWFIKNWPQIRQGFLVVATIAGKLPGIIRETAKALQFMLRIGKPIFMFFSSQLKIILTIFSGLFTALSKIPKIGGKFEGAKDAVNAAREGIRKAESGYNTATGGKGGTTVVLQVDKKILGSVTLDAHQRQGRQTAAQSRGRLGGHRLATT